MLLDKKIQQLMLNLKTTTFSSTMQYVREKYLNVGNPLLTAATKPQFPRKDRNLSKSNAGRWRIPL